MLVALTCAPETTAPPGSLTMPEMVPVILARATVAQNNRKEIATVLKVDITAPQIERIDRDCSYACISFPFGRITELSQEFIDSYQALPQHPLAGSDFNIGV